MKKYLPVICLLLLSGCSSGVIVHDQFRAAELVIDFLTSLKSKPGIKLAYEWTDDRYKKKTSLAQFSEIIALVRGRNLGADIQLAGYEVFGAKEKIVLYAISETQGGKMYFRFSLSGSKSMDYYLMKFDTSDDGFAKRGLYREFEESIVIEGV